MTTILSPSPKQKFFTNNGAPANKYKLFTYSAGTTTKTTTWTDSTGGTPNTNPIILDYRGECNLWISPNVSYKYVLAPDTDTDPPTNAIWTVDNLVSSQLITLYGGVDTGSVNAYVLNFTANFSTYTDGIVIYWIPANSNTGGSTINVNGIGVVSILNANGTALYLNQLQANTPATIIYQGGKFILMNSQTPNVPGLNIQNANYTLLPSDTGNIVVHNDSNPYTYSIPLNATTAFAIGSSIEIINQSTSTLTISPVGGVTLYPFGEGVLLAGTITLQAATSTYITKTASDTWIQSTQTALIYNISAFTGTIQGCTAFVTGTIKIVQIGNLVTLYATSALTGLSNSTSLGLTGLPAQWRPILNATTAACLLTSSAVIKGGWASIATSGIITFGIGFDNNNAGFVNDGLQKGFQIGWSITYPLM